MECLLHPLKKARVLQGITQFKLSLQTSINSTRLSLLENGFIKPRQEEKEILAKVLKVDVKEIFPEPK
jgi:transcriptional regulator with XRE-family HTH domain